MIDDVKKGLSRQLQFINQDIEKEVSPGVMWQIQEYVNTHWPFDSWSEGIIYKVPVKVDWSIKYFLVAKKRYDHNISKEFANHKYISNILDKNLDFKKDVDIPKLYGKFDDATENEAYIIMDFIQGKTLFAKLVETICDTKVENDKDAEKKLREFVFEKTWVVQPQFADLYAFLKKYVQQNVKLFSYKEGVALKYALRQFINHIHQNWFYHRDIGNNWRNIMFGDDWKIYIIDFGMSIITNKWGNLNPEESKDVYSFTKEGNIEKYFAHDEAILEIIETLTLMPPKKDSRELNY